MTRLQKAHTKFLSLQTAYDELKARGASPALRSEMLDIVSEAHTAYTTQLHVTLALARAGLIPERQATA